MTNFDRFIERTLFVWRVPHEKESLDVHEVGCDVEMKYVDKVKVNILK